MLSGWRPGEGPPLNVRPGAWAVGPLPYGRDVLINL